MKTAETIWVHLHYRSGQYDTVLSYADSLGNVHRAPSVEPLPRGWVYQPLVQGQAGVWWPRLATRDLLGAVAAAPSWREGPYGTGPVPVAVIIRPPEDARGTAAEWEARTEALLETLGVARTKYSLAIDALWTSAPSFLELPLKILVAGDWLPKLEAYAEGIGAGIEVKPISGSALEDPPADSDVLVLPPAWRADSCPVTESGDRPRSSSSTTSSGSSFRPRRCPPGPRSSGSLSGEGTRATSW